MSPKIQVHADGAGLRDGGGVIGSIGWAARAGEQCNMKLSIRREFVVDAPLKRAWDHLARVEAWPSWAKHIRSVRIEPPGELSPSTMGVFQLANPLRSGWPGIKARFAMTEFAPKSRWK